MNKRAEPREPIIDMFGLSCSPNCQFVCHFARRRLTGELPLAAQKFDGYYRLAIYRDKIDPYGRRA
jgi:hypothetical protein